MDAPTAIAAVALLSEVFNQVKEFFPAYRQFKIRSEYDDNVFKEQYIKSMSENVHNISEENFQYPNPSIIYPAMKESFFYIREKEIREMFAKLISSSFDKSKNEYLHPGFIGIIKQLSPLDARLLMSVNDSKKINGISAIKDNVEYRLIESDLLKSSEDVESISLSIENLERLGLIHVSRKEDMTFYEADSSTLNLNTSEKLSCDSPYYPILSERYNLYSVNAYMTVLGKSFLKVCVD